MASVQRSGKTRVVERKAVGGRRRGKKNEEEKTASPSFPS